MPKYMSTRQHLATQQRNKQKQTNQPHLPKSQIKNYHSIMVLHTQVSMQVSVYKHTYMYTYT